MIRIAICDDDIKELSILSNLLNEYKERTKTSFTYSAFSNSVALLEAVQKGGFDFVLLDVMMPFANGMEIAHEIREFNREIKLAFLTSSPDFAVESYSVEAFAYLLKPSTKDNLFPMLDKLFQIVQKPEDGLTIKFQNGVANIPFYKFAYVEVSNRMLFFHLTDGSIRKIVASLSEYEGAFLQREEFIRVHRSFIVNLQQIQELYSQELLTFTGDVVPVSRRLYPQVRKAFMEHLFAEKGVK